MPIENMPTVTECEYHNCTVALPVKDMINVGDKSHPTYVCPEHEDNVYDQTGYCSMSCQLGYGCDQSC